MNKKNAIKIGIGIITGSLVAGGTFIGIKAMTNDQIAFSKQKLSFINYVVGDSYITQADRERMTEGIYEGYVYGLEDSHTAYLSKEKFNKQKVESGGNYIGTGIKFTWGITNQYLMITEVIKDSPADKAGLKVGQRIVAIDDIPAMMSNEIQIYEKLVYTGEESVNYRIQENNGSAEKEVALTASVVGIDLVKDEMLEQNIGYIKLDGLGEGDGKTVEESLTNLKAQGAKKLILDLRGTSSDQIEEVRVLCDLFLANQKAFLVVDKQQKVTAYNTSSEAYEEPIILLTNRYTEGAIEAFVGAVKESKRGLIIGEKTAGNGTLQQLIELEDGSGLNITTGIIQTPSGKTIKDGGITPDIVERVPTANTLELVTTGSLKKANDMILQKAITSFK